MDNSIKYTYTALRLEQQPNAPVMYLLGVDAGELLQWASVPEAKADYMAGYQRMYSETRADEIRDFLASDPNNIIPGSVIVTVSGDAIDAEVRNDGIVLLTIEVVERNFDDRLEELYQKFSQRLSEEERISIAEDDDLDDELGAPTQMRRAKRRGSESRNRILQRSPQNFVTQSKTLPHFRSRGRTQSAFILMRYPSPA